MSLSAKQELDSGPGFIIGPRPPESEVAWLRDFVTAKWRAVLIARYPELRATIDSTPISAYHTLAPLIDHAATWTKDSRLFSAGEVAELQAHLSAFRALAEAFGPYEVADIEGLGHPEVYWRLVRPREPDDVSGAHADSWFFTVTNNIAPSEQARLVKVWLPVIADLGASGLSVGVGSQLLNLAYTGEMRHGRMKPKMTDPRAETIAMTTLPLHPGQCVAFHTDLLHKGVSHATDRCRVSIEFAIRLLSAA